MKAAPGNPCNRFGHAIMCERCGKAARFLRERPARDNSDMPPEVYKMGLLGIPIGPRDTATTETMCEDHIRDWTHGICN